MSPLQSDPSHSKCLPVSTTKEKRLMETDTSRGFISYTDDMRVRFQKTEEKKAIVRQMGGEELIARQHEKGKLTARERLQLFFDQGAFVEHFTLVDSKNIVDSPTPADGVVTGYGEVDGRPVVAYATDATIFSGACGEAHMLKIVDMYRLAGDMGVPIIAFIDSAGARLQEAMPATPPFIRSFHYQCLYSGVIPQITVVCGLCAAGQAYGPVLADFTVFTRHTGKMWLAGPRAAAAVTHSNVAEYGGAEFHMRYSGSCDFIAEDDYDAIRIVKEILGFCPSSWRELAPLAQSTDDPERAEEDLLDLVPASPKHPLDMYKLIQLIVDDGVFLETKKGFGQSVITGFCRFAGQPCGIIASNPAVLGGCLEPDSSDKFARFLVFCDCFNLPVITLVDCPAFVVGSDWEKQGVIRHGTKLISAYALATVPKIGVIIRKSYGGSTVVWGSKPNGADFVYAWPTAELSPMGPDAAVAIIYHREMQLLEKPEERQAFAAQKKQEYFEKNAEITQVASSMRWNMVDEIIDPRHTRGAIVKALRLSRRKKVQVPERKRANPPL